MHVHLLGGIEGGAGMRPRTRPRQQCPVSRCSPIAAESGACLLGTSKLRARFGRLSFPPFSQAQPASACGLTVSTIRVMSTGLPSWLQRLMMRFCRSAITCTEGEGEAREPADGPGSLERAAHLMLTSTPTSTRSSPP